MTIPIEALAQREAEAESLQRADELNQTKEQALADAAQEALRNPRSS